MKNHIFREYLYICEENSTLMVVAHEGDVARDDFLPNIVAIDDSSFNTRFHVLKDHFKTWVLLELLRVTPMFVVVTSRRCNITFSFSFTFTIFQLSTFLVHLLHDLKLLFQDETHQLLDLGKLGALCKDCKKSPSVPS
jgi:hypothetical protein